MPAKNTNTLLKAGNAELCSLLHHLPVGWYLEKLNYRPICWMGLSYGEVVVQPVFVNLCWRSKVCESRFELCRWAIAWRWFQAAGGDLLVTPLIKGWVCRLVTTSKINTVVMESACWKLNWLYYINDKLKVFITLLV